MLAGRMVCAPARVSARGEIQTRTAMHRHAPPCACMPQCVEDSHYEHAHTHKTILAGGMVSE